MEVRTWMAQGVFQGALIVGSILIALAFDEWREEREEDELVARAQYSFSLELKQNLERLDDAVPFNSALFDYFSRSHAAGEIDSIDKVNEVVRGLQPTILENTAWSTAVATGALAKMDYELVAALSLTYNMQSRYILEHQANVEDLENRIPRANEEVGLLVAQALKRLHELTEAGVELQAVYQQMNNLLGPVEAPDD